MKRLDVHIFGFLLLFLLPAVSSPVHALQEEDRMFMVYDSSNGLADNSSQIVACTRTGRILVTTHGHINFFSGAEFTHIDPKATDAIPLSGYHGRYQMYFDRMHHLWLKNNGMLTCLNLTTETFIHDVHAELRKMGINFEVSDLWGDGISQVWLRHGNEIYCPTAMKRFTIRSSSQLQEVDVYKDSLLLMFHADGTVVVNDYRRQSYLYRSTAYGYDESKRYGNSSEICLIGDKYYQLRNGVNESVLMCYDINKRKWTRLLEKPFHMNSLFPKEHLIYIGSNHGYLTYDIHTNKCRQFDMLTLTKGRRQLADINSLTFDLQGGLWLATRDRGLLYSKAYPSPFKSFPTNAPEAHHLVTLMNRQLSLKVSETEAYNCTFTDSRGWIWNGSYLGLELKKPDGKHMTFTTRDGLTNNVIHAIVEDNNHHIWVSTSYGINHLYIRKNVVYHIEPYINQDNIPNESFLNGRGLLLNDGNIVMQSLDHVVSFKPSSFQGSKFGNIPIYPKLVKLAVIGNEIEAGEELDGKVIIEKAVSRTRHINVNYNQNSLSLTFSGLNYLRPIQTYYRVRIKGVQGYNNWRILSFGMSEGMVDKNGQLHLPLLGLDPGDYTIEVQTSLWPEKWEQEPYTWIIHVEQPWWRTTGLYITLCILLMALMLVNFFFYNQNTRLRLIRNNEENDILRRIRSFAARCQKMEHKVLTVDGNTTTMSDSMSPQFVEVMLRVIPFVNGRKGQSFTVSELAAIVGMKTIDMYSLLSMDIDKNPHQFIIKLRLQEAARMLETTTMTVEEIADQCRFSSCNFFIASFFHQYRQTPQDYRITNAR